MIRLVLRTILILSILETTFANAQNLKQNDQDSIPEKLLVSRINALYSLKSSQLIFDLNQVPISILENLNSLSTPNGIEVRKLNVTRFIANENEPWEATDAIRDKMLPTRKFLFAINDGTEWIFSYILGGIARSIIIVYTDSINNHTLNIFITKNNKVIIDKLLSKKKIRKLLLENLNPLLQEDNICVYNGELWMYSQPMCYF